MIIFLSENCSIYHVYLVLSLLRLLLLSLLLLYDVDNAISVSHILIYSAAAVFSHYLRSPISWNRSGTSCFVIFREKPAHNMTHCGPTTRALESFLCPAADLNQWQHGSQSEGP